MRGREEARHLRKQRLEPDVGILHLVPRKPLPQIALQLDGVVSEQDGAHAALAPRDEDVA
jgi:hypothetical protein